MLACKSSSGPRRRVLRFGKGCNVFCASSREHCTILFCPCRRAGTQSSPRRPICPENSMVAQPNSLAGRDVASLIHPYTNLEAHRTAGPTVIAKGEGVYVWDDGGKKYLE